LQKLEQKYKILKNVFGFPAFRSMQEDAVDAILAHRDLAMLLPTGGGKSLCYQLPSLVMEGVTIVVSPLIALMQDQITALKDLDIESEMISSAQSQRELQEIYTKVRNGKVKLLYVAPERLANEYFISILKTLSINFFVIDEAHCISEWGHEFRSDYRRLGELRINFPKVSIAAFTATATPKVRDDILSQLGLKNPLILKAPVLRKNIKISVRQRESAWRAELIEILKEHNNESGIIYTFSRKEAEELADFLLKRGFKAAAYHAGMSSQERHDTHKSFLNDDTQIIAATIAFGMGIDKSDIRFVIHTSLPKTIENYYQEIGRAGRDGVDSQAVLFFSGSDFFNRKRMIEEGNDDGYREVGLQKLKAVMDFASAEECRHKFIASYFEDKIDECKERCDNCLEPNVAKTDITVHSQKLLSAIYKTGERFGAGYAAEVLIGENSDKILSSNHNKLSVFGIGKELNKREWGVVAKRLIEIGALEPDEYKSLKITLDGAEVLRGKRTVFIKEERMKPKKSTHKTKEYGMLKPTNFAEFKELRSKIAKSHQIPSYIVFSDKTLYEMAEKLPTSKEDMLEISGVGVVKFERYGSEFLKLSIKLSSS